MTKYAAIVLTFALAAGVAHGGAIMQDQAHYEQAIRDRTGAPYFILIDAIDDASGKAWSGCTLPSFVRAALDIEQGRPHDDAQTARDADTMLAAKDHSFHFSNPKALAELRMDAYAPADLDRARVYLHAHGTAFLLASDWTKIDAANALNRTALACAIIEKGLAARMADGNGETFAEP